MVESILKNSERTSLESQGGKNGGSSQWAASRMVRRLTAPPAAIYNWLAGPPVTGQERSRAQLADVRNAPSRGTLVV